MPVNPQVRALLDEFEKQGLPPFDQMSVTQARVVALGFRDLQGEPENLGEVRDILVPGPAGALPVRLYHPAPGQALPLVVYFHGGGWVIGDLEIVDKPCRALGQCIALRRCIGELPAQSRRRNFPVRRKTVTPQRNGWPSTRTPSARMAGSSRLRATAPAATSRLRSR